MGPRCRDPPRAGSNPGLYDTAQTAAPLSRFIGFPTGDPLVRVMAERGDQARIGEPPQRRELRRFYYHGLARFPPGEKRDDTVLAGIALPTKAGAAIDGEFHTSRH